MATKGTGRGGLESQVQEYGCRKMNFADISIAEIVISTCVHLYVTYVNYVDLHTVYYV